jgi:hypothetical protein
MNRPLGAGDIWPVTVMAERLNRAQQTRNSTEIRKARHELAEYYEKKWQPPHEKVAPADSFITISFAALRRAELLRAIGLITEFIALVGAGARVSKAAADEAAGG